MKITFQHLVAVYRRDGNLVPVVSNGLWIVLFIDVLCIYGCYTHSQHTQGKNCFFHFCS